MFEPDNFRKLTAQEIQHCKDTVCKQRGIYLQGNTKGEAHKCSYCDSKEVRYSGSVWLAGGIGSFFYLACEKCYKKSKKRGRPRGQSSGHTGWGVGVNQQGMG